jgi:ABC-type lipopolysaccharide export system ATPase subunit
MPCADLNVGIGISPIHIETIKDNIMLQSKDRPVIMTDHDNRDVIDIASKLVVIQNGNTKIIKELNELVDFGYLPESFRGCIRKC